MRLGKRLQILRKNFSQEGKRFPRVCVAKRWWGFLWGGSRVFLIKVEIRRGKRFKEEGGSFWFMWLGIIG